MLRPDDHPNEPTDVFALLYGNSLLELEYMARVYRKYGIHAKADEIYELLNLDSAQADGEDRPATDEAA